MHTRPRMLVAAALIGTIGACGGSSDPIENDAGAGAVAIESPCQTLANDAIVEFVAHLDARAAELMADGLDEDDLDELADIQDQQSTAERLIAAAITWAIENGMSAAAACLADAEVVSPPTEPLACDTMLDPDCIDPSLNQAFAAAPPQPRPDGGVPDEVDIGDAVEVPIGKPEYVRKMGCKIVVYYDMRRSFIEHRYKIGSGPNVDYQVVDRTNGFTRNGSTTCAGAGTHDPVGKRNRIRIEPNGSFDAEVDSGSYANRPAPRNSSDTSRDYKGCALRSDKLTVALGMTVVPQATVGPQRRYDPKTERWVPNQRPSADCPDCRFLPFTPIPPDQQGNGPNRARFAVPQCLKSYPFPDRARRSKLSVVAWFEAIVNFPVTVHTESGTAVAGKRVGDLRFNAGVEQGHLTCTASTVTPANTISPLTKKIDFDLEHKADCSAENQRTHSGGVFYDGMRGPGAQISHNDVNRTSCRGLVDRIGGESGPRPLTGEVIKRDLLVCDLRARIVAFTTPQELVPIEGRQGPLGYRPIDFEGPDIDLRGEFEGLLRATAEPEGLNGYGAYGKVIVQASNRDMIFQITNRKCAAYSARPSSLFDLYAQEQNPAQAYAGDHGAAPHYHDTPIPCEPAGFLSINSAALPRGTAEQQAR